MIRFMVVFLSLLMAAPGLTQERIFYAAKIDLEQNDRLTKLEKRQGELDAEVKSIKRVNTLDVVSRLALKSMPDTELIEEEIGAEENLPEPIEITPVQETRKRGERRFIDGIEHSRECVDGAWVWLKVNQPVIAQTTVSSSVQYVSQPAVRFQSATSTTTSSRYSTDELRSIIYQKHPGQWTGPRFADVQPRSAAKSHLINDHGFTASQVNGLSQNESLILHDYAHGGIIKPYRTGYAMRSEPSQMSPPVATRFYNAPVALPSQPQAAFGSGCANGQCAKPVRRGLFGRWSR